MLPQASPEVRDLEAERQHLLQVIADAVDPEIMKVIEVAVAYGQPPEQWDLVTTGEGSVNAKSE